MSALILTCEIFIKRISGENFVIPILARNLLHPYDVIEKYSDELILYIVGKY